MTFPVLGNCSDRRWKDKPEPIDLTSQQSVDQDPDCYVYGWELYCSIFQGHLLKRKSVLAGGYIFTKIHTIEDLSAAQVIGLLNQMCHMNLKRGNENYEDMASR